MNREKIIGRTACGVDIQIRFASNGHYESTTVEPIPILEKHVGKEIYPEATPSCS